MNCWFCANAPDAPVSNARPSQNVLMPFMVFLLRSFCCDDNSLFDLRRIGGGRRGVDLERTQDGRLSAVGGLARRAASHHQCGNGHKRSFSLAICHKRAKPCGSTIRKKMIRPPKIINSRFDATLLGMLKCREVSRNVMVVLSRIGSSVMKALPRKAPSTVPTPPIMIMNRMRNERSRLYASGSTVPRYA